MAKSSVVAAKTYSPGLSPPIVAQPWRSVGLRCSLLFGPGSKKSDVRDGMSLLVERLQPHLAGELECEIADERLRRVEHDVRAIPVICQTEAAVAENHEPVLAGSPRAIDGVMTVPRGFHLLDDSIRETDQMNVCVGNWIPLLVDNATAQDRRFPFLRLAIFLLPHSGGLSNRLVGPLVRWVFGERAFGLASVAGPFQSGRSRQIPKVPAGPTSAAALLPSGGCGWRAPCGIRECQSAARLALAVERHIRPRR